MTALLSKPRRMSMLDRTFLQIETRDTPMHVAGLQVFQLPDDAPVDFCKQVTQKLRSPAKLSRPWNLTLAPVTMGRLMPAMAQTGNVDLDYHVRHTCLPAPGGERELGELVSHLHSTTLDRSRPLWTCHVIEGLENNRFALYTKLHHAIIDGVKGMHLLTRCLGTAPGPDNWVVPWEDCERPTDRAAREKVGTNYRPLSPLEWPKALKNAYLPLLKRKDDEPIRVPFEAPNCMLNGRITAARRVATQRIDLGRVKAVAKKTGVSVNDVFLELCSAALRRHLLDNNSLPDKSLVAGVPISLRADVPDADSGNAVGFLWAILGTEFADPMDRLRAIARSTKSSKAHLQGMVAPVRGAFTTTTMLPVIAVLATGQGAKLKPSMNVVISNVPGPNHALYLGGARLEAMYPVSIPLQGLGLNITCVSYNNQLTVGFTGSRDGVPHLQRVAVFAAEALDELEAAAGC